jgi:outer membrane protein OmpA-like peptidoglycan-associated protein
MAATHSKSVRLTPFARVFMGLIGVSSLGYVAMRQGLFERLVPHAKVRAAVTPAQAPLPTFVEGVGAPATAFTAKLPETSPGCPSVPEVRMEVWAWNAQMGLMLATGGPQATVGSAMCAHGVNLHLLRQDDGTKMREDLVAFATALKNGEAQPKTGTAFVAIMGDGSAAFLSELNAVLRTLGPGYGAKVVGSAGYSWGEDKFMGPPAWRERPAASKGGLVAGVLRDGDWNIAQKWLGENRLCTNPDEHTWDPGCLNWFSTPGYVEAAQAYVAGTCEERAVVNKGVPTGERRRVCVDGVVTWTPGDVMVAQKKGGLVSIVSTREYRGQMPHVIIGIDRWMQANRPVVEGLLAAMFEGAEQVKTTPQALAAAAQISATVYGEETGAYWAKYFPGVQEKDAQGLTVELGGSRVNTLADDLQLFGVTQYAPGSTNLFAATYTVFGNLVVAQYPDLVPSVPPVGEVLDVSYVTALAARQGVHVEADLPRFAAAEPLRKVVSRGAWTIAFAPGSAQFAESSKAELDALFDTLVIANGAAVEVHGHTDSQGDPKVNLSLSEARAFAVKQYLEARSTANFPQGRVRVFAHGPQNPVAPNGTPEGRAQNRRVEIVLGTTAS